MLPSKCVIFPIKKKFLKRNYSRTAVIFQALKMKCSLVICRIAIKQEMSLFQTFGLPLFVPIGFHEQDWLLAMTLQRKTLLQNWHRLFNACWGTSALVSFMCVSLHGQNLLCWTIGYHVNYDKLLTVIVCQRKEVSIFSTFQGPCCTTLSCQWKFPSSFIKTC